MPPLPIQSYVLGIKKELAMNPNVSWIIAWQQIVRSSMPYLITVF